jgi:hypothetical protein
MGQVYDSEEPLTGCVSVKAIYLIKKARAQTKGGMAACHITTM